MSSTGTPEGMAIHFALDLETLATSSPLLLSVGIVVFSTVNGKVHNQRLAAQEWYLQQRGQFSSRTDLDTFLWWLRQPEAVRRAQVEAVRVPPLNAAIDMDLFISKYLSDPGLQDNATFWANGVDWQWLQDTLWRDWGPPAHFRFRQVRDFRTVRAQLPLPKVPDAGAVHTALADAEWVVRDLDRMCRTYPDFKIQ